MSGPAVIGHRGCAGLEPENTLRAFRRAAVLGCDAVELDVRLSRDGALVVIHDETVERTTGGRGRVCDLTVAELSRLDAGAGERIPTLEQVLMCTELDGLLVQIELKGAGTEEPAASLVRRMGMTKRTRFTSFFHRRVESMRRLLPESPCGLLIACSPIDPQRLVREAGATSLHVDARRIDRELVNAVHEAGAQLIAWGHVTTPAQVRALADLGVDAIGSDTPDMVIRALRDG